MNSKTFLITKIKVSNNKHVHLNMLKNEIEVSINNLLNYISHMKEKIGSIESRLQRSQIYKDEWPEVKYTAWIRMYRYIIDDFYNIETDEFKIDNSTVSVQKYESRNATELDKMLKEAQKWLPIWENTLTALNEENELLEKEINAIKKIKIELKKALLDFDLPEDEQIQIQSKNHIDQTEILDKITNNNVEEASVEEEKKTSDADLNAGKMKNPNKGITKRIRNLIKELKLDKSEKYTDEIRREVCEILKTEGFEPNEASVYSILNKEGINNDKKKLK